VIDGGIKASEGSYQKLWKLFEEKMKSAKDFSDLEGFEEKVLKEQGKEVVEYLARAIFIGKLFGKLKVREENA